MNKKRDIYKDIFGSEDIKKKEEKMKKPKISQEEFDSLFIKVMSLILLKEGDYDNEISEEEKKSLIDFILLNEENIKSLLEKLKAHKIATLLEKEDKQDSNFKLISYKKRYVKSNAFHTILQSKISTEEKEVFFSKKLLPVSELEKLKNQELVSEILEEKTINFLKAN